MLNRLRQSLPACFTLKTWCRFWFWMFNWLRKSLSACYTLKTWCRSQFFLRLSLIATYNYLPATLIKVHRKLKGGYQHLSEIQTVYYRISLVVICSMNYIRPSGEPFKVSGICTLPINIFNEMIYLINWFWYLLMNIMSLEIDSN